MKTYKAITLFAAVVSLFISASVCAEEAKERPLPTTEDELAEWLAGTEWVVKVNDHGKDIDKVFRFLSNKKATHVTGTRKWSTKVAAKDFKYKINNPNTIQYGSYDIVATFGKKFTYFRGKSRNEKTTVYGKLSGRFIDEEKTGQSHAENDPDVKAEEELSNAKPNSESTENNIESRLTSNKWLYSSNKKKLKVEFKFDGAAYNIENGKKAWKKWKVDEKNILWCYWTSAGWVKFDVSDPDSTKFIGETKGEDRATLQQL